MLNYCSYLSCPGYRHIDAQDLGLNRKDIAMPTPQTPPTQPKESCTITIRDIYGKDLKDIVIPAGYEYAGFGLQVPDEIILTLSEAAGLVALSPGGNALRIKLRKLPPPPVPPEYDYLFVRRDTRVHYGEYYFIGIVLTCCQKGWRDHDHEVAIYRQVPTDNRL